MMAMIVMMVMMAIIIVIVMVVVMMEAPHSELVGMPGLGGKLLPYQGNGYCI